MDENLSRGYCSFTADNFSADDRESTKKSFKSTETRQLPKDPCSCVYLCLVLAGAGFLLPYNSFITAVDYFQEKFPGTTIVFDMSLTYICIAFLAVFINNVLVETFSVTTRITFGYVVSFCTLFCVAVFEVWYELLQPSVSYGLNLLAVAVVAFGCTVQQSSFYGYTGMLPRRYTQAVMTGESVAGLTVSVNRILTKAFLRDERTNTMIFFSVSVLTVFLCFLVFMALRKTAFVQYHTKRCEISGVPSDLKGIVFDTESPEEVEIISSTGNGTYGITETSGDSAQECSTMDNSSTTSLPEVMFTNHKSLRAGFLPTIKRGLRVRYEAAKTVWTYMLSIALAYFMTLALFPGIESEITSCSLGSWMPVIIMAIFNACDFIGKIIASLKYDWPRGRLVLCSLCRCLLIPLMMLAAMPREDPVIHAEAWSLGLSAVLGLTNGYFGSVPMIIAPSKVKVEHREITGNIMTLSYSIGLTLGSAMSYLLDAWIGEPLDYDPCSMNGSHILQNGTALLRNYAVNYSPLRNILTENGR